MRLNHVTAALTILAAGLSLAGVANAASSADLDTLRRTKQCAGCDLSGTSFGEEDLSGADLRGANLRSVAMGHTNLRGANLDGADLSDGVFYRVDFNDASVNDVKTRGALFFLCKGW